MEVSGELSAMKKNSKADTIIEELRGLLNEWNPIGGSLPPDEYDCLLKPLLGKLRAGCNEEFVERLLKDALDNHFGLSSAARQAKSFSKKVCAWYRLKGN